MLFKYTFEAKYILSYFADTEILAPLKQMPLRLKFFQEFRWWFFIFLPIVKGIN